MYNFLFIELVKIYLVWWFGVEIIMVVRGWRSVCGTIFLESNMVFLLGVASIVIFLGGYLVVGGCVKEFI